MSSPDALLVVGFGGPEQADEVMPFLRHVAAGRGVPEERLLAVAEHYQHFGDRSPINDRCRDLVAALQEALDLPIYWGNRNWKPWLDDTVRQMSEDGVRHALAFVTSAFGSPPGCRRYRDSIAKSVETLGPAAPRIDKLPLYWDHPGFLEAVVDRTRTALREVPEGRLVFTAHSIPESMASLCSYDAQLREASQRVADAVGTNRWDLVYQSRSGPPSAPWLGPDVGDHLESLAERGEKDVVVVPIGFAQDHMEVVWDLDTEARERAEGLGMRFTRAGTVGCHPAFVAMICELVEHPAARSRSCPPSCCQRS